MAVLVLGGCDTTQVPAGDAGDALVDAGDLDMEPLQFDAQADASPADARLPDGPATDGPATDGPATDGPLPDGPLPDAGADAGHDAAVPTPCAPCEGDDDCPGGLCLTLGLRGFCGADCATDEDCDDGFDCASVDPDDDESPTQCRPLAACPECADDDPTCDGVDDDCDGVADEDFVAEACGQGACAASSACVDGEVVACSPGDPTPDTDCDGVDDDCDGEADEDFVGDACGLGACMQAPACVDGEVLCAPGQAAGADATCDGVDDDCDGETDEDFVTAETCGDGACERDAACVGGEQSCVPGEPLSDTDVTCDGVDDDCDGEVDESCQRNLLGFRAVEVADDHLTVEVVFEQEHSPTNDGVYWLPRSIDLRVLSPEGLSLVLPNQEGVLPGPAVEAAGKRVETIRYSETETRFVILSQVNTGRIEPGVLLTLRYAHAGLAGPFHFGWNAERTNFAPIEALEVLSPEEADLP